MSIPPGRKRTVLKLIGIVVCIATIVAILVTRADFAISTSNILSKETTGKTAETQAIPVTFPSNPDQQLPTLNSQGKEVIDLQTQLKNEDITQVHWMESMEKGHKRLFIIFKSVWV